MGVHPTRESIFQKIHDHPLIDKIFRPATPKTSQVSHKGVWKSSFSKQVVNAPIRSRILSSTCKISATDRREAEAARLVAEESAENPIDYARTHCSGH